jgi:hypothetical protein
MVGTSEGQPYEDYTAVARCQLQPSALGKNLIQLKTGSITITAIT